jgi:hypothetical protein
MTFGMLLLSFCQILHFTPTTISPTKVRRPGTSSICPSRSVGAVYLQLPLCITTLPRDQANQQPIATHMRSATAKQALCAETTQDGGTTKSEDRKYISASTCKTDFTRWASAQRTATTSLSTCADNCTESQVYGWDGPFPRFTSAR